MERSAIYRRALAPIMLFAGMLGVLAAAVGLLFHYGFTARLWLTLARHGVSGDLSGHFSSHAAGNQGQRAFLVAADAPGRTSIVAAIIGRNRVWLDILCYRAAKRCNLIRFRCLHSFGYCFTAALCTPPDFSCRAESNYLAGFLSFVHCRILFFALSFVLEIHLEFNACTDSWAFSSACCIWLTARICI